MSKGYQDFTIVGNLGGDPQMRYTPTGKAVTNFNVAVNSTKVDQTTGEATEIATWFHVSTWEKLAELCNEFLSSGRQVLVKGKLVGDPATGGPRIWTDQNGKPRASFEIKASEVIFLGSANGSNSNGQSVRAQAEAQAAELSEDEIPF
jgi:single-strand DNA-binding protein